MVHGDKYDYSLVIYQSSKYKIKIVCHIHGIFEQTPNSHLSGHGCPRCGTEQTTLKIKMTIKDFINKSHVRHNNKYDYTLVDLKDLTG